TRERRGRLPGGPATEPAPRTEIDMAVQWWETADGARDRDHRDQSRILRAFAQQTLAGSGALDATGKPSRALNQLVASESLRDLGGDRFAFRHDVLRDWAVANLRRKIQPRSSTCPWMSQPPLGLDAASSSAPAWRSSAARTARCGNPCLTVSAGTGFTARGGGPGYWRSFARRSPPKCCPAL